METSRLLGARDHQREERDVHHARSSLRRLQPARAAHAADQAALRELREETGYVGSVDVAETVINTGTVWVRYECFYGFVEREFAPELTEHVDYRWTERGTLPSKMVTGAKRAVEHG